MQMFRKTRIAFAAVLMLVLFLPLKASAETPDPKKITDVAQLSYINTQGNTDLTTMLLVNSLKYTPIDYITTTWKIEALKSSQEGKDTAERYMTSLRLDYRIESRLYTFADVQWLRDVFANIDDRYYLGAGLGYKILAGPSHILDAEGGINYTMDSYSDNTDNNYTGGRIFAKYAYLFSEKNKFEQTVEYLHDFEDSENYNINSETAIIAALNSILSLKTSYQVKYDNEPAGGAEYADRIMAVTLVVNLL